MIKYRQKMREKILIIEDDKDIVRMLDYNLKKEGFRVISAATGEDGLILAGKEQPGLIMLDMMLPKTDGLEVCKHLKKEYKTASIPIIMLTAKTQEADKVVGLEFGADDYVTKPFSLRELIARIKAVIRRSQAKEEVQELLKIGELAIDFARIAVYVKNKPIELTSKEFELLKALIKAKGRVLSRDYLLDAVWGFDKSMDVQTRTVDVHIRTLRKKLKAAARHIITVKNYGYRFEV